MDSNRGMILWTLGGAGVFLLYAAYKNQSPQTLLLNHLNGTAVSNPIAGSTAVPTITDAQGKTWNTAPGDGGYITTDPPSPDAPAAPSDIPPGDMLGSYRMDANGVIVATAADYRNSPKTYIPQVSNA